MRKASDYEKTTVKVAVFWLEQIKIIGHLRVYGILRILTYSLC